ncbi:MAG TPA: hypothetical protein VFV33_17265 [Gemmatimonadaceae bacterium]|nr:hypothetical protein [Gemmatimonadaceae bacterium]
MRHIIGTLSLLLLGVVACEPPTQPARMVRQGPPPTNPPVAPPTSRVASLRLQPLGTVAVVGRRLSVGVLGWDTSGRQISVGSAVLTLPDERVASIDSVAVITVTSAGGRDTWTELRAVLSFKAEGTTTLRVTLDDVTTTLDLQVRQPQRFAGLAVDTFTVLEARVECAWDCPYLAYWPLLKLRELSGQRTVTIDAVEFTIPGMSTGLCQGAVLYGPGASAFAVSFDPYLWSNDILFVRLDGTPVPDGEATASVYVHDDTGKSGLIDITGKIQRQVKNPFLPKPAIPGDNAWSCQ